MTPGRIFSRILCGRLLGDSRQARTECEKKCGQESFHCFEGWMNFNTTRAPGEVQEQRRYNGKLPGLAACARLGRASVHVLRRQGRGWQDNRVVGVRSASGSA